MYLLAPFGITHNALKRLESGGVALLILNLLQPTGHVMNQQFNIQQLYTLPTLYLCVLYLSENKQRLVPLTAQTD
jgi:ABC-type transporter Mla MlaB component